MGGESLALSPHERLSFDAIARQFQGFIAGNERQIDGRIEDAGRLHG